MNLELDARARQLQVERDERKKARARAGSAALENSVVSLLNLQIERLTKEMLRKGEELVVERQRAEEANENSENLRMELKEVKDSMATQESRTESIENRLRESNRRTSVLELSAATESGVSTEHIFKIQSELESQLNLAQSRLEAKEAQLSQRNKDFAEVEALGCEYLISRDKIMLDLKSAEEALKSKSDRLAAVQHEKTVAQNQISELVTKLDFNLYIY